MGRRVRLLMWVVAGVQAVFAILFTFRVPWATALFPFEGTSPLSAIFLGSIFAAAAASTAWCLLEHSDRGLIGIALDYITIFVPYAVFSFAIAAAAGRSDVAAFGIASLAGVVLGAGLLRSARQQPWRDPRPLPRLVRWSFVVFVLALVPVGLLLVVQVPGILPWTVTPEISTLFGLIFLGAASYFAFGLVDQRWENAGGQLAGFLAYDVVLIVPFLQRLPSIEDSLRLSLIVYTTVVIGSALVSIYYLGVNRETRLRIGVARDPLPTAPGESA